MTFLDQRDQQVRGKTTKNIFWRKLGVPLKFIYTYMTYTPDIEPENFNICLILLTQPSEDRWTPLHLSKPFLNKIKKIPVKIVELENGSHYPVKEPALDQLHSNIVQFINEYLNK